jgi:hypothetical protein
MGEIATCIKAQQEYCHKNGLPCFAPSDGYCPRCRRVIYGGRGYSLERASTRMITGCPYCNTSYCD